MTASPSPAVVVTDDQTWDAVWSVATSLRDASARLGDDASKADVRAAERVIDRAERSLGMLSVDPWEPTVTPLRHAREILSSHLLAADACAGADAAPPVTARVLRRGAESARRVLLSSYSGVQPQD